MKLGAYSLVRYSNNMSDQRVNLGILVWHPLDGFANCFSPYLDRAKSVDPWVRITPLKEQLEMIKNCLVGPTEDGKEVLLNLAEQFREGLEVTAPYPAKIFSLSETLEKLYQRLISPVPEIVGVSNQRQFQAKLKSALTSAVGKVSPKGKCDVMAPVKINGVSVDPGIRTKIARTTALWRALSLQSKDRPAEQVTAAKATAMEIVTIRQHCKDLKNVRQLVVLQPPKPKASEKLSESISWLNHEADEVITIADTESLLMILQAKLSEPFSQRGT